MTKEYYKTLNMPEARHRYWHIPKAERDFFPDAHIEFKIEFDGRTYSLKVNHKEDIMTGKLYERYHFLEGDRIIIKKKKDGHYQMTAPDTRLYPAN